MELSRPARISPLISHRLSLCFPPAPPTEATNTLVLNGGGARSLYTDFRPLTERPGECEWAFAGEKMWLGEGRARWARFVDSRWKCGVPEREGELPDEGVCEATENGDELERGLMVNPTTGKVEQYEEVWRDEKVPRGARAVAAVLIKNEKIQGVWVRVGRWCQGVVDVGDGKVNASRWMFQESEWVEVERYGQADWLPSPHGCTLQDTYIRWGNDDWTVEEDYMY